MNSYSNANVVEMSFVDSLVETVGALTASKNIGCKYKTIIQDNLFSVNRYSPCIVNVKPGTRLLLVIDASILKIYGQFIYSYFEYYNISLSVYALQITNAEKNTNKVMDIVNVLQKQSALSFQQPFLAIGGSTLLDLAGYAASLHPCHVPYIRIPTNLMALIDTGLGVKASMYLGDRRNHLAVCHAPTTAYLDRTFIKTTSDNDITNGLAEILKLAVINDAKLFSILEHWAGILLLQKFQDNEFAHQVLERVTQGMLTKLSPNLWAGYIESCVDCGHSFYSLTAVRESGDLGSGEAVALDILFSSIIAARRALISWEDLDRIIHVMKSLSLPLAHHLFLHVETVWQALQESSRYRSGQQRLPLPSGIGHYIVVNNISRTEVSFACNKLADMAEALV